MAKSRTEAYVFGLICTAIITVLSLTGAVVVPLLRGKSRSRWMQVFVALAVATLSADALLHLIPAILGAHEHKTEVIKEAANGSGQKHEGAHLEGEHTTSQPHTEHDDHGGHGHSHGRKRRKRQAHDDHSDHSGHSHEGEDPHGYLLKMSAVMLAVYIFYLFEFTAHWGFGNRKDNDQDSDSPISNEMSQAVVYPASKTVLESDSIGDEQQQTQVEVINRSGRSKVHQAPNGRPSAAWLEVPPTIKAPSDNNWDLRRGSAISVISRQAYKAIGGDYEICCGYKSIAFMILIGDGIHNFADGLAIGASFASRNSLGFSTAIAVAFHELPHEIGDFAVLIDSGLSVPKALIMNFLSACTAFAGLVVGIELGQNAQMVPWLLAIAAGMFLYVAWIDMLNHLKNEVETNNGGDPWYLSLALQNAGFITGFVVIFLIGWFEDDILNIFT